MGNRSSRMYIQPKEIAHGKAGKQPAPDRMLLLLALLLLLGGGWTGDVGMTIVGAVSAIVCVGRMTRRRVRKA